MDGGSGGRGGGRPFGRRALSWEDCGHPKKRQMQMVMQAADLAAASTQRRIVQNTDFWYGRLLAMSEALQKKRPLTTTEWIKRAKEDPGKWIQAQDWAIEETRCKKSGGQKDPERDSEEVCSSTSNAVFLPFHLIFSRLPVRQLFQLRCVCKLWNLMLQGPDMMNMEEQQQEEYWFVMSQPLPHDQRIWNFRGFSSLDRTSFRVPLPCLSHGKLSTLLGGRHCSLLPQFEHRSYAGLVQPRLVSAGGLMCAFVHKLDALDDYFVVVFNCLTGSVRVLPPLLNSRYLSTIPRSNAVGCHMYMSVDEQDPGQYYVMLTQQEAVVRDRDSPYFEIFDSRRGSWRVTCNIESAVAVADSKVSLGDFFFLASEGTLLVYHAADDLWSKVLVPRRESIGLSPTFSKYKGRILQGLSLTSDNTYLGFVVWELQFVSSKPAIWVEVARTPQHLWQGLSCKYWAPTIRAEGGLFCMTFEDSNLQGHFRPPLVYDITQNSWYVLPGSTNFGCILVHRPRLSMCAPRLEGEEA